MSFPSSETSFSYSIFRCIPKSKNQNPPILRAKREPIVRPSSTNRPPQKFHQSTHQKIRTFTHPPNPNQKIRILPILRARREPIVNQSSTPKIHTSTNPNIKKSQNQKIKIHPILRVKREPIVRPSSINRQPQKSAHPHIQKSTNPHIQKFIPLR